MNQELLRVIELYQRAVEDLFPRLANHLGVSLPITNREWSYKSFEQRGETPCGITYFVHGYGVSLKKENIKVDFDLGSEGQINGIDPWKLWYHLEDSGIQTAFKSSNEIKDAIKHEVSEGNMVYSGYILYYLAQPTV